MYWVTGVILLIYLVLVYLLGRWLPLHGSDVWILRGVLALLGLIGAAVAFWYQYKLKQAKEAEGAEEGPDAGPTSRVFRLFSFWASPVLPRRRY